MKTFNSYILFKLLALAIICTMMTNTVRAQSINLQVVSKKVEKKLKYKEGQILTVQGEKSKIDLTTWEEDYISVKLVLSAQHPDRKIAEEDLKYFEYNFDNSKDTIFIHNSITSKDKTLRSGLQADYTIRIPENCKVKLDNYFGTAKVEDLSQGIDVHSEFCNLNMKNILGKVDINTYFGDFIGFQINGDVNIKARRSNVTLTQIEGKYNIDAYEGIVKVYANQSLLDMNINAIKSDVFFYDSELGGYNFDLTSRDGDVELPDVLAAKYTRENDIRNIIVRPEGELIGVNVAINVISGDIMLKGR